MFYQNDQRHSSGCAFFYVCDLKDGVWLSLSCQINKIGFFRTD